MGGDVLWVAGHCEKHIQNYLCKFEDRAPKVEFRWKS